MPAGKPKAWLIGAALLLPAAVPAAERAAWPQFQGDASHSGFAQEAVAPPLRERWRFPLAGSSSPVLLGETVYAVGRDLVVALDVASGEKIWSVPTWPASQKPDEASPAPSPAPPAPSPASPSPAPMPVGVPAPQPAIVSSPEQALIYAVRSEGKTAIVSLDLERPDRRRELATIEPEVVGGLTVVGDRVFVGAMDGSVTAVSTSGGGLVWSQKVGTRPIMTPPAVHGETLVTVSADEQGRWELVAISTEDGAERWRVPVSTQGYVSGPSIAEDRVFITADGVGVLAVSLDDGRLLWTAKYLSPPPPLVQGVRFWGAVPAATGDRVYAATISGAVVAVSAADGRVLWDYQLGLRDGPIWWGSPVAGETWVAVGSQGGGLVVVDESGRGIWRSETGPGALLPVAITDQTLIAGKAGSSAGLVAFRHDPEGRLTSLVSPTVTRPATVLVNFAVALLATGGLIFLVAGGIRLLLTRLNARSSSRTEEADPDDLDREWAGEDAP